MELDISNLKPPTGDTASISSTGRKPKKKSVLSKLVEKKRRSSESGSEIGSCVSLQSSQTQDVTEERMEVSGKEQNEFNLKEDKNVKLDATSDDKLENFNNNEGGDMSNNANSTRSGLQRGRRVSGSNLRKNPKPAPRLKKPDPDLCDWDPPPPLDADDNESNGTKAPSDATIHRFRALKMANDPKGSLESLKSLPFQPKPPQTPKSEKKSKGKGNSKGEKRNHEAGSSGEEVESKSKKQSSSYINLKAGTEKYEKSEDDAFMNDSFNKTANADSDSVQMNSPRDAKPSRGPLPPVAPKSHLPPLGDITSTSLKTTMKTDPSYSPQKYVEDSRTGDTISQRSLSASCGMLPITIREARARTGSRGNVSVTSSLVGAPELERYFPDHQLKIWVGSWNMGDIKECKDSQSLQDFILPVESEVMQDIYAVGTQENNYIKKDWEVQLQATLGPTHVLFHSSSHGSLHLAIFIRRDLIWFCSVPEDEQISTRAVTMVRTKGAVAISFYFFGTSFLFVNCHLTSDDGRLKDRITDYHKITTSLKMPKYAHKDQQSVQGDALSKYDSVFWFGDLNFRIDKGRNTVEDLVTSIIEQEHPNFEFLLEGDELNDCIVKDQIFHGFLEGRINFKPTYKFDVNKDDYDTSSKLRIPSYTDRILFKAKKKNSISCHHYDAVMNLRLSDHRPVYGLYEATIKPGRDNIPMAAGHFDRDVYVEANKRWDFNFEKGNKYQKSSSVCAIQ